jgi:hypothetical protein
LGQRRPQAPRSKDLATPPNTPSSLASAAAAQPALPPIARSPAATSALRPLRVKDVFSLLFCLDCHTDGSIEDLFHAFHFLRRALHVAGAHSRSDGLALLCSDGSETLSAEEVDAVLLVAQVGFETEKDKWSVGKEVEDFRVPLRTDNVNSHAYRFDKQFQRQERGIEQVIPCP